MRYTIIFLPFMLLLSGCSTHKTTDVSKQPKNEVISTKQEVNTVTPQQTTTEPQDTTSTENETLSDELTFSDLPSWDSENHQEALESFISSCKTKRTQVLYEELCKQASVSTDAKEFFMANFTPFTLDATLTKGDGIMTGYYEPLLKGSLTKKEPFIYPIYSTPRDLITVDLTTQYKELKNYRLRGRVNGDKLIPYYSRKELSTMSIDADIVCYVDDKIDLFFLEVQGSGRVLLDNGETIFVGFDNLNGYKYTSIGKYLISQGEMTLAQASMRGIKDWCNKNPSRVDELLNQNESFVFFKQRTKPATGSLGVVLTPQRSIAIDDRYIPLGSVMYLSATTKDNSYNKIVMAQDTGGAIKGTVRADLFFGYGAQAGEVAGRINAPLKLWILMPKIKKVQSADKLSRQI